MYCPTVTEVIDPYADFSRVPSGTLAAAADRGTRVHGICAAIARGLWVPPVPDEYSAYIASFRRWIKNQVVEVILCEERLVDDDLVFSGQIDLLVRLQGGDIALVDLKTPVSLQKAWRVQLAAYYRLCCRNGFKPDRVGSLRLSPDGGTARMEWYEETASDLNVFLQALNVDRFFSN